MFRDCIPPKEMYHLYGFEIWERKFCIGRYLDIRFAPGSACGIWLVIKTTVSETNTMIVASTASSRHLIDYMYKLVKLIWCTCIHFH